MWKYSFCFLLLHGNVFLSPKLMLNILAFVSNFQDSSCVVCGGWQLPRALLFKYPQWSMAFRWPQFGCSFCMAQQSSFTFHQCVEVPMTVGIHFCYVHVNLYANHDDQLSTFSSNIVEKYCGSPLLTRISLGVCLHWMGTIFLLVLTIRCLIFLWP